MTFWTFALLALVFGWIAFGRLVNADTPTGKLTRDFLAALVERVRGRPQPKEEE